jgi:hypothetical protein
VNVPSPSARIVSISDPNVARSYLPASLLLPGTWNVMGSPHAASMAPTSPRANAA